MKQRGLAHSITWTDQYGNIHADFVGRPGGYQWLVVSLPEEAANIPTQLAQVHGKGHTEFLVYESITALQAAVHAIQPYGVLVVAQQMLHAGPALNIPLRPLTLETGLELQEGGQFPAWRGAQMTRATKKGECLAASAIVACGYPVKVCTSGQVTKYLSEWMASTPHGQ